LARLALEMRAPANYLALYSALWHIKPPKK